jgi:hypothetical protein
MTGQLPNHRERLFMQYLRGAGWEKMTVLTDAPGLVIKLLGEASSSEPMLAAFAIV